MENTYPAVLQHIGVPLSQVFTPLIVVHALDLLAFGKIVSNDTSFHGLDPCFADVFFTRLQFRCRVTKPKAGGGSDR